jgi:hypothetical protein
MTTKSILGACVELVALLLFVGAIMAWGDRAHAATISPIPAWNGVNIQGDILAGDDAQVVSILSRLNLDKPITVVLNSDGGDIQAAAGIVVQIDKWQRAGVHTYVGKTDVCASACVLIFAMGQVKFVALGGSLLVHAATTYNAAVGLDANMGETAFSESMTLRSMRLLKAFHAPDSILAKAMVQNPDGNTLTYSELADWGTIFLSDVDGHQFKQCRKPVAPENPFGITCAD